MSSIQPPPEALPCILTCALGLSSLLRNRTLYAGVRWNTVRECADRDCKSTAERMHHCRDSPAKTTDFHAERMHRAIDREDAQMRAFTVLINEESARAEHAEHNMQQELEQVPVPAHQGKVSVP